MKLKHGDMLLPAFAFIHYNLKTSRILIHCRAKLQKTRICRAIPFTESRPPHRPNRSHAAFSEHAVTTQGRRFGFE